MVKLKICIKPADLSAEDLTKTVFPGLERILGSKQGLWEADEDFRPKNVDRKWSGRKTK